MLAAFDAACCAANGVPLRDPRNPSDPELFHDRTFPFMSEMVTIVLLKDACTNASPCGTCVRSFFLKVFFLPFFSGAAPVPPAAAGFAIESVSSGQWPVVSIRSPVPDQPLLATDHWQLATRFSLSTSSSARPFPCEVLYAYGHSCAYVGREPGGCGGGGIRDRSRS